MTGHCWGVAMPDTRLSDLAGFSAMFWSAKSCKFYNSALEATSTNSTSRISKPFPLSHICCWHGMHRISPKCVRIQTMFNKENTTLLRQCSVRFLFCSSFFFRDDCGYWWTLVDILGTVGQGNGCSYMPMVIGEPGDVVFLGLGLKY